MTATMTVKFRDFSGQKSFRARGVTTQSRVDELVRGAISEMGLRTHSEQGEAVNYHARLDREGRHLLASERVGQALLDQDELVLHPNIDAG
jgi:hypothetical protein